MSDANNCEHERFSSHVEIFQIEGSDQYQLEITVNCDDCGVAFEFLGMPFGERMHGPAMSVDCRQARLPMVPAGTRPHPLAQVLGFELRRKH